jgi:hypothetical protein
VSNSEEKRSRRSSRTQWAGRLIALASIGGLGFWLGSASNRVVPSTLEQNQCDDVALHPDSSALADSEGLSALQAALGESWGVALGLSGQIEALEASLEALSAESGDELAARRLMAATVENMSEWELRNILGAVTRISTADLDEIEDLHAYSARLIDIAADGVLYEEGESGNDDVEATVFFTGRFERDGPEDFAEVEFDIDQEKIYANFRVADYEGRRVLIKWTHSATGRIHLLQNHLIAQGGEYGWVWLKPDSVWLEGDYKVRIFSGDEELRELAAGHYAIREG